MKTRSLMKYRKEAPKDLSILHLYHKIQNKQVDRIEGAEGIRKETLESLIAERDKYKSMYQNEVKKNNNSKIVIESQKRLIERTKVETITKKVGGYDMMRPKTQGRFG